MSACRSCGWRLVQRRGLCATCATQAGVWVTTQAEERQRLEEAQARMASLPRAEPPPKPNRTIIADGIEFDIVFDGRQSLLGDYARRRTNGS